MEAAGIEPASRDVSGQASTCVVGYLGFAPADAIRQAAVGASRRQGLGPSVADATRAEPELAADFQASPAKALSRGYRF